MATGRRAAGDGHHGGGCCGERFRDGDTTAGGGRWRRKRRRAQGPGMKIRKEGKEHEEGVQKGYFNVLFIIFTFSPSFS